MEYNVTVEKVMLCNGIVSVDAKDEDEAQKIVDKMIGRGELSTGDIDWDDPEYIDFTFQTTGDVQ